MSATEIDEYGFDVGTFRYRAAAMVKYVIRAREQTDPGFLGEDRVYSSWHLESLPSDRDTPAVLLDKAARIAASITDQMIAMGGSGGVHLDDPLGELKANIAAFADNFTLSEAAKRLRRDARVNWNNLARWELLPAIRSDLDKLPHPRNPLLRDEAGGTPNGPHPPSWFFWNGVRYEFSGLPFKLVSALWLARGMTLPIVELASCVWGDERQDIVGGPLNSVCNRTNGLFKKGSIPLSVRRTGDFVSLVAASSASAGTANGRARK